MFTVDLKALIICCLQYYLIILVLITQRVVIQGHLIFWNLITIIFIAWQSYLVIIVKFLLLFWVTPLHLLIQAIEPLLTYHQSFATLFHLASIKYHPASGYPQHELSCSYLQVLYILPQHQNYFIIFYLFELTFSLQNRH